MSVPVVNSTMSVIWLTLPGTHFSQSVWDFITCLWIRAHSGPKSVITTCRVLWSERNFAIGSFHNHLKRVLCLPFLPEFQNTNSPLSIFISLGEATIIFQWPLYSLPQDRSSFIDIPQRKGWFHRLGPGSFSVLHLRVGIREPKYQGAALFSVDILHSDC